MKKSEMLRRLQAVTFASAAALSLISFAPARAADNAPAAGHKAVAKNPGFETLKSLVGTWVSTKPGKDDKISTLIFKLTSGGTAITETLAADSEHEMLDVYTIDGQNVVMTHYCAMGNQPRMKLVSAEKNVLKFEYVDGGNLKSRDEPHMDSLTITIDGDKLTEDWAMYQDGKVMGHHTFEFKRK